MQQHFNLFVFKHEQMLYEREGIEWSFIQFPDNADILDLLENRRTGIFALCDEQVKFPKATDLTLVSKIYEHCSSHPRFYAGPKDKANNVFVVKHFAGPVCYSSQYFLEKNHDVVRSDMAQIIKQSSNSFISTLYDFMRVDDTASTDAVSTSTGRQSASGERKSVSSKGLSGKISTLSAEFRVQLDELMQKINGTSPHYVRCLKPNTKNIGNLFDPQLIIGQLRCGGVLEAVRVSRAGYPNRYTFEQFVNRYELLGHTYSSSQTSRKKAVAVASESSRGVGSKIKLVPKRPAAPPPRAIKDTVEILCANLADMCWASTIFIPSKDAAHLTDKMQRAGIQKGSTMIFLRSRTFEFLERELQLLRTKAAIKVQTVFRRYSCMTSYRIMKKSSILIQSTTRKRQAKQRVQRLREFRAIVMLLRHVRGFLARFRARKIKLGVCRLQAVKRGQMERVRVIEVRRIYHAARIIQCKLRCIAAKRIFKKKRIEAKSLKAVRTRKNITV